ncbi:MAG TPA: TonB-dependent receptor [Bryobacteraceae bacterium]|nr:TonB-dependent receptor [Bryobacteraceae bacterium]
MMKSVSAAFAGLVLMLALGAPSYAQSISSGSGTVRGSVLDPTGAAVPGATVRIANPVSSYDRTTQTDSKGNFEFDNIPYNNYHSVASASGFQTAEQDLNIRSTVPIQLKIGLTLGAASTSVTVTDSGDLVENDPTTHTDIDRNLFDKLPLESQSSGVSSLVTLASPGVSADSNGLFHGLGDHASNSFSVDGQPITDQQSKVFSNQIPLDSVQSLEVIEGAPPAEYGGKTSLVIVATTRSGLGVKQPHGDITASYGTFGTSNETANLAYGGENWGNFISLSGLNTGRFLDGPELQVFHDHGNEQNLFDRADFKLSQADSINFNFGYTRSWFQTPNSYDAQNATAWSGLVVDNGGLGPNGLPVGSQDQRSQIRTINIAPVWTRLLNPNTVFTFGGFFRQDQYNYYPSANPFADFTPGVQQQTIGQDRRLTNAGLRTNISYVKGIHNLKIGATYQHTFLSEKDTFGIVDPTFNPVCLNGDGSADTDPGLTEPSQCSGNLQQNPNYSSALAGIDLTRPGASTGQYLYKGRADIKELGVYIQDTISIKNWTFNLGLRGDKYNGLTSAGQAEPRVGVAYHFKPTNTVLRASYARSLETPFNENLVLASTGCNDPVINALESTIQGYPCLTAPLKPGTRNEYHVGLTQAFGRYLVVDGEYIWKYTNRAYDFSILGNSPITFPIEWAKSKIPGYAVRATVPNFHGLTAYVAFSSVAARFFGPQVSGIGTTPSSLGDTSVFRIDHDELFNQTTHLQYQPWKNGPWFSFNWRYDSGLVAGPVPCAGGNCANGPNGSDTVVDFSGLTPDQQFQAGLSCAGVRATPTTPISPTGTCLASQYTSSLVKIPAPGTENDDHNPPRISSRNLFDIAIGDDNIFRTERYKWSARLTVVNLTNANALYNFLSTFSGTHYVTPRTVTATVGFHF